MLLCYITDRKQFPGDENARREALLRKIGEAARSGVRFIQLREKDLPARELEKLAKEAVNVVRENAALAGAARTVLLINSRTDVAIASAAHGVHLRSDDISPADVRMVWAHAGLTTQPIIGVSCHSVVEVARAASAGADFAVLAPVFEKKDSPLAALGLAGLRQAYLEKISVLALGGITLENARSCVEAGAAGVAGIRLFQDNNIVEVVRKLGDS